jgi:hypothetical protein
MPALYGEQITNITASPTAFTTLSANFTANFASLSDKVIFYVQAQANNTDTIQLRDSTTSTRRLVLPAGQVVRVSKGNLRQTNLFALTGTQVLYYWTNGETS